MDKASGEEVRLKATEKMNAETRETTPKKAFQAQESATKRRGTVQFLREKSKRDYQIR